MTNKEKYINLFKSVKREDTTALIDYLERSDFFTAPASSQYHLAKEGGLCEHSLNVYNRLCNLWGSEYGGVAQKDNDKLLITALLHDLCKIGCYMPTYRNEKVYSPNGSKQDAVGNYDWVTKQSYKFEESLVFGYHGAKSAYIASQFIKLNVEEHIAICNHMGAYDRPANDWNVGKVFEKYPLAFLLHTADCMASFIDEVEK